MSVEHEFTAVLTELNAFRTVAPALDVPLTFHNPRCDSLEAVVASYADPLWSYLQHVAGDAALGALEELFFELHLELEKKGSSLSWLDLLNAAAVQGAQTRRLWLKSGATAAGPLGTLSAESLALLVAVHGFGLAWNEGRTLWGDALDEALGEFRAVLTERYGADVVAVLSALWADGETRLGLPSDSPAPARVAWEAVASALEPEFTCCPDSGEIRARVQQRIKRRQTHEAERSQVRDQIHLTCSYCRDQLTRADTVFCADCLAPHHADCFDTHGSCSTLGCAGAAVVRAGANPSPPRLRRLGLWLALPLGLATIAAFTANDVTDEPPAIRRAVAPITTPVAALGELFRQALEEEPVADIDELLRQELGEEPPPADLAEARRQAANLRKGYLEGAEHASRRVAQETAELIRNRRALKRMYQQQQQDGVEYLRLHQLIKLDPSPLLDDLAKFARLFARKHQGPTVEVPSTVEGLAPGTTCRYPAGSYDLNVDARGREFPSDLLIVGAGMNATLLRLNEISSRGPIRSLTFRDLTLHANNNYLTDVRGNEPITLRLERCRVIGFDMGAGGSVMFSASVGAFYASNCRIEAGFSRTTAGFGNLFRCRPLLLARLERCTLVGPFRSILDGGESPLVGYRFVQCTLVNATRPGWERLRRQGQQNLSRLQLGDASEQRSAIPGGDQPPLEIGRNALCVKFHVRSGWPLR